MDTDRTCCCGNAFATLTPTQQAERLARLAQQARLLQFSLKEDDPAAASVADGVQRALEQALDADATDEADIARHALDAALAGAHAAGMRVTAALDEVEIEGVAGVMRMRVLSAVLSRTPLAA
jgi:hypothetical protein